jgi:predicted transcriptional regulator
MDSSLLTAIINSHPGISIDEAIQYYKTALTKMKEVNNRLMFDVKEIEAIDTVAIADSKPQLPVSPKLTKKDLVCKPSLAITHDSVKCCICGKEFSSMTEKHLQKHNLTKPEYLAICEYPSDTSLTCMRIRDERREKMKETQIYMNSPNYKNRKNKKKDSDVQIEEEKQESKSE